MTYQMKCSGKDEDGCRADPELGYCSACGFVFHDIPRAADEAHGELCCGTPLCSATGDDLCVTHFRFPGSLAVMREETPEEETPEEQMANAYIPFGGK